MVPSLARERWKEGGRGEGGGQRARGEVRKRVPTVVPGTIPLLTVGFTHSTNIYCTVSLQRKQDMHSELKKFRVRGRRQTWE